MQVSCVTKGDPVCWKGHLGHPAFSNLHHQGSQSSLLLSCLAFLTLEAQVWTAEGPDWLPGLEGGWQSLSLMFHLSWLQCLPQLPPPCPLQQPSRTHHWPQVPHSQLRLCWWVRMPWSLPSGSPLLLVPQRQRMTHYWGGKQLSCSVDDLHHCLTCHFLGLWMESVSANSSTGMNTNTTLSSFNMEKIRFR